VEQNGMTKPYFEVKNYLDPEDGQLRDFYIFDVSPSDWDKFISVVSVTVDHFTFEYLYDGVKVPLPSKFSDIVILQQEDRYWPLLSMWVSGLLITCLIEPNEIDLVFSVFDIQNAEVWEKLLAFFQKIVDHIGKKGVITYEWNTDRPEIRPDLVIEEILPCTQTPHQS
jgi:hypothetical protein